MARIQEEQQKAIGRNDPCPCGSGKKYKKCCEKEESAKELFAEQNEALQAILQEFFQNNPTPKDQKELLAWKNETENLLVPLYGEEKSGSIIGDLFFFANKVETWNSFIERKKTQEQKSSVLQVLETWTDPLFLGGEILEISNYRAHMRDILSGDLYEIDVNESFPVEKGTIAFGFYLPDPRLGERFLMALNSVTVTVEPDSETIEKLKSMYASSVAETAQTFYKQNLIAVYQMFSSGLLSAEQAAAPVLEAAEQLEQFFIEHDLKSNDLIEAFFHFLQPMAEVPKAAVAGALQFGITQQLLASDWTVERIADEFKETQEDVLSFAEELQSFYERTMADHEKEATYAFEVGTHPKANELPNWQLFMHLKNAAITSETAMRRQIEYYHDKRYEPKSDAEHAQFLAYEAFTQTEQPSEAQIKRIHALEPTLVDGFLLAAETQQDEDEQEALLLQAVRAGQTTYELEMEVPWLYVPNRPYLRSVFVLGVHYWERQLFEKAFGQFQKLLQLNPGDHQGARYLAVSSLIACERLAEAESLIGHYEEPNSDNAFYAWFRWSIQRKREMHAKATQDSFLQAVEQNPYTKKYVNRREIASPYPKKAVITPRTPEEARLIWTLLAPGLNK